MSTDHIVLEESNTCRCLHCDAAYQINMPAPLSVFQAIVKAFIKLHRDCEVVIY